MWFSISHPPLVPYMFFGICVLVTKAQVLTRWVSLIFRTEVFEVLPPTPGTQACTKLGFPELDSFIIHIHVETYAPVFYSKQRLALG